MLGTTAGFMHLCTMQTANEGCGFRIDVECWAVSCVNMYDCKDTTQLPKTMWLPLIDLSACFPFAACAVQS